MGISGFNDAQYTLPIITPNGKEVHGRIDQLEEGTLDLVTKIRNIFSKVIFYSFFQSYAFKRKSLSTVFALSTKIRPSREISTQNRGRGLGAGPIVFFPSLRKIAP